MTGHLTLSHRECGETFLDLLKSGAIQGEPVLPIVWRCPGCGRTISPNKACCLACGVKAIERDAKHIRTTEELEAYLGQLDPSERDEARALVEPIMMKKWEKTEDANAPR